MTERKIPEADADWQVEGGASGSGDGLGDTVVKMPRMGANGRPAGRATMGRGAGSQPRKRPASGTSDPTEPTSSSTDDLMAAFDQPMWEDSAPPKARPVTPPVQAPSMAAPAFTDTIVSRPVPPTPAAPAPTQTVPTQDVPTQNVPIASVAARPVPAVQPKPVPAAGARRTRKARLRVSRVDPWSVMKTVFLFSVAFGIMGWVATYLLWQVLLASGLFDAINEAIASAISSPSNTEGWRIEDYISANKVLGFAALLAVLNTVITTALGTLAAFLYNLSANILGGLELTLAED